MEGYGSVFTGRESDAFRDTLARSFKQPVTHAVRGATPHEGQVGVRYREWSFGAGMNYVHDIELGADGRFYGVDMGADGVLWFTMALSNQIGRMDVASGEIRLRDLYVHLSHHKLSGEGHRIFNLPYGLDIDPVDGSVWYSKLYADRIGRVDPRTLEIEEFATPHGGPRRMRFAPRAAVHRGLPAADPEPGRVRDALCAQRPSPHRGRLDHRQSLRPDAALRPRDRALPRVPEPDAHDVRA
jgi:hypothetical protein